MDMKTLLASLTALTLVATSANAAVLLGGFHGENETAQQSATVVGDVSVTLTRTGASSDITQGWSQMSSSLWGSEALDVAAADSNSPAPHAIVQSAVVDANDDPNPFTLVMTITNTGTNDVVLGKYHYRIKKDINNEGPNSATLTYMTGDLTDTDGSFAALAIPNGTNNAFDIDLSGFLTDTTLSAGESAVFTWAHGPAENPAGNTAIRIDNMAISGEVIPEPASLALLGIGGLLIAARRRRA